nr:putative reverse transcriptase domain-containing protein [Tanacetum cinerariifolium]
MQAACDREKSYVDLKRKPMEFQVKDKVMLKVSTWKGVVCFGKQGKLNPRYVGPFKCHADKPFAVPLDGLHVDDKLHFVEEPMEIMDREVKRLKQSSIPLVKARGARDTLVTLLGYHAKDLEVICFEKLMSSDSHATITYTSMSSYEVIVNRYYGMPMDPLDPYVQFVMEAPPSPDYIHGPEAPPSPDYIPGPEYPEYLPPADDVLPAEEQPLPAVVSPTAESPGYIMESEPEMEPEEEDGDDEKSEEDSIEYPTSGGDDDVDDDGDDVCRRMMLMTRMRRRSPQTETEPFEECETATTPPPFGYRVAARISVQPHILMPFRSESERDVSTLQRQHINDEDRLTRHIQHEHAQRDVAPEDGDSCS